MLSQSSPVAKTAFDSLQAKQSAVSVGYGDSIVVKNSEIYTNLLKDVSTEWKTKRQTPLVNAGYASRVLAISHSIDSFVSYHRHRRSRRIQIVFLGCGADVIGLWAHSLDPSRLSIIELDTPEVCAIKRDLWIKKKFVEPDDSVDHDDAGTLVGRICSGHNTESSSGGVQLNYALYPADLRRMSQLHQVANMFDARIPTLAVSELVLTYLTSMETDGVLSWCSSHLCSAPGSSIIALEPLGYETPASCRVLSAVEGYKREYCTQFRRKMARGKAVHSEAELSDETSFHPIGVSHQSVAARFEQAGFGTAYSVSLGRAVAHANTSKSFLVPEIFDEHSALAFHLKSYAVICGFSEKTETLLKRMMCPYGFSSSDIPPLLTPDVIFTIVESIDEIPVRTLFYNTYCHLFDEYPAIRKMTNGVMNGDFSIKVQQETRSVIGNYYNTLGGCFLVALRYDSDTNGRQVIGFLGIRKCDRKDKAKTLEIFRLVVDANYRGRGVGKTLMNLAESFARSQGSPRVIANTVTILESAIRLYEACGYKFEKDTRLGTLVMRTFIKDLDGK